ncbi:SPFH domain-containing protein [Burkholderia sp. L27(2015)]|uniref:SPFH domain-containing protein n=1 Tax=Burkholderia sp. L27(2015) TaxID=1641858 RepID=UPI00131C4AE9|nr:SPFH domain-containing protein [Burkholderia sp. L27(2015)]
MLSGNTAFASRLAYVSFALAALLGGLPSVIGGGFYLQWCAVLASAWINVLTVAVAAQRPAFGSPRERVQPSWPEDLRVWRVNWWCTSGTAARKRVQAVSWQPWAVLLCATLSSLAAAAGWHVPVSVPAPTPAGMPAVAAAGALILAFGTLVAERYYSMHSGRGRVWASLASVLRAALAISLIAALCAGLLAYSGVSTGWPVRAMALFSAAIALELALRAVFSWFRPSPIRTGDAYVVDARMAHSSIASLLRWRSSAFTHLAIELRSHYGVDLRQNWVLLSVVRLLPAAIATIGVCAWLLTGVVMLGPEQRAVYERFGAPVAVWQPGPHVALPWPFGQARVIDNGAVHQLVVSGSQADSRVVSALIPADAATPEPLNRLWDVVHEGETSQVIAGASGDRQNFQIVSADVRLDYRIGLSDAAARASLYHADDVPGTLRAIANREVVRYLASHTLDSLLETRQTAMADSIRLAVQTQLDQVASGIDVVAVVIESVHPPAGASSAWHSVQAAQIRAQASVAQARGQAAASLGDAQQQAQTAVAQADAQAADITSAARIQQTDFGAEMVAAQTSGPAFVLEYYLHNLQNGLQNAHVTLIDDRLVEGNRATIDLRSYGSDDAAGARRIY